MLFINGLPLVVIELKNPADLNADHDAVWNQIQNYKAGIPQRFWLKWFLTTRWRYGSLSTDVYRYNSRWQLLDSRKVGKEQLEFEVLMRGLPKPAPWPEAGSWPTRDAKATREPSGSGPTSLS